MIQPFGDLVRKRFKGWKYKTRPGGIGTFERAKLCSIQIISSTISRMLRLGTFAAVSLGVSSCRYQWWLISLFLERSCITKYSLQAMVDKFLLCHITVSLWLRSLNMVTDCHGRYRLLFEHPVNHRWSYHGLRATRIAMLFLNRSFETIENPPSENDHWIWRSGFKIQFRSASFLLAIIRHPISISFSHYIPWKNRAVSLWSVSLNLLCNAWSRRARWNLYFGVSLVK